MAVALEHLLETRAVQLAVVHLTRRRDVSVTQEPRETRELRTMRTDLLVSLLEEGQDVGQFLAVEVKAAASDEDVLKASRKLSRQGRSVTYFPFPICLFVFSMETDQGYWRWVRQPELNPEDKSHLFSVTDVKLSLLTKEALNQILASVREWYQQRNS